MTMDSEEAEPQATPCYWHYDHELLRRAVADVEGLKNVVGTVNPRLPGWHNDLLQHLKKWLARALGWYTRPAHEFNASVSQALEQVATALEHLSMNMHALDHLSMNLVALEGRLAQSEKRSAALVESIEQQLEVLHGQPTGGKGSHEGSRFYIDTGVGNDRTAYVIGLFGTGRLYVNDLIVRNIGDRARYFRDTIRLHPGPTPMIYSGHATRKYVSGAQALPEVTKKILEGVRSGFADVIFIYRHPLDSLLTNWNWWRNYIRQNRRIAGTSQVHDNKNDHGGDLERNFREFRAFAEGDADFFAGIAGPRFLSFPEFIEETELHLQSATLALRLEDFAIDPLKEFSKIAEVMSVSLDLGRLRVVPPRAKSYGYLAAKHRVPQFREFIAGLSEEAKQRIGKFGYEL
jgi:hypothetical protein